jgi:hypothetical protein
MRRFSLELMVIAGVPVMEPSHSPITLIMSPGREVQGHEEVDGSDCIPSSINVGAHASRRTRILCSSVSTTFTTAF